MDIKYYREIYSCGKDILKFKNTQKEKCFIQHGNVSVYKHTIKVAISCLKYVDKRNIKVDRKSLIRGALLHDYFLYDWHEKNGGHRFHGFTHAKKALINAEEDFKLNEVEKDMIACHMFPLNLQVPKYRESRILCLVDKICAINDIVVK